MPGFEMLYPASLVPPCRRHLLCPSTELTCAPPAIYCRTRPHSSSSLPSCVAWAWWRTRSTGESGTSPAPGRHSTDLLLGRADAATSGRIAPVQSSECAGRPWERLASAETWRRTKGSRWGRWHETGLLGRSWRRSRQRGKEGVASELNMIV
jgi:hypothetical protein